MAISGVFSTAEDHWQPLTVTPTVTTAPATLTVTQTQRQAFTGFGLCFNELGMQVLNSLTATAREQLFDAFFAPTGALRLRLGRLPIGASDYAASWYSYDEVLGDTQLQHFSIGHDEQLLLPYLRAALTRVPDLKLFASPWSPPTWLKTVNAYNYGQLKEDPASQQIYANYLLKYLQAYQAEGVQIAQLHIQNEPASDQKFPSCVWSGAQLKAFIKVLGPLLEASDLETELWLGTINSANYDEYAGQILHDSQARQYIKGVGYQWAGKEAIAPTHQAYPELPLLQTENECGNGHNSWAYAEYVFDLIQHYVTNGVGGYCYWNGVLAPGGRSTWGWQQNALITVDPATQEVTYNPEFYVLKHCSHALQPGAHVLATTGELSPRTVAFQNPDGSILVTLANQQAEDMNVDLALGGRQYQVVVPAHAFASVVTDD